MNLLVVPIAIADIVMIGALVQVIYSDFFFYKIRNHSVLALLGAWAVVAASDRFAHLPQDLLVAGLIFALAYGFWLLGMVGAGDAKLLGACALAVGFDDAFIFTVLILAASIAFIVLLRILPKLLLLPIAVGARLAEIAENKKIPYGVPIALAAIYVIGLRLKQLLWF